MANLIPWEPFRELVDIGNIFDRFFGRMARRRPALGLFGEGFWAPAIDVYDKEDRIVVKAELPGIDKKDVKVSVDGDILSIRGETKKAQEVKEKDYYYSERAYGSFYRTLPLPVIVEKEKVKASYKDGILTIELPKTKEATSKETDVQID
ncbi:MAG: Hsp20/alpha crystallin family protein [bacterium]